LKPCTDMSKSYNEESDILAKPRRASFQAGCLVANFFWKASVSSGKNVDNMTA
jgi:hypothetical protein